MAKNIDFYTLLRLTQEYISQHYAAALTDKAKLPQLKAYIDKYLPTLYEGDTKDMIVKFRQSGKID